MRPRQGAFHVLRDLVIFFAEQPLAAVAAFWIICFPAMYLFLYGDLGATVVTLAGMTLYFVAFLLVFLGILLGVSLLVACGLELRARRRRSV